MKGAFRFLTFLLTTFFILSTQVYSIDFGRNCKAFYKELLSEGNSFTNKYKELLDSMDTVDQHERNRVLLALDALHFIDYYDQLDELLDMAQGRLKVKDVDFPSLYNKRKRNAIPKNVDYSDLLQATLAGSGSKRVKVFARVKDDSFSNFLEARHYLMGVKPKFNSTTFKKLHALFMKGKVDNLAANKIGTYRNAYIVGNVPSPWAITPDEYDEILKNPYLQFFKDGETREGKLYGVIGYPHVSDVQKKTLDLIRTKNKKLVERILKFQEKGTGSEGKLNQQLMDALVDDAFDWFHKKRESLGELTTVSKIDKFIELVADFQKRLISIHPFTDGNGRTTREFGINYALILEGLPPARLVNPDDDLYTPDALWKDQVKWGVISTYRLLEDFTSRAKMGLSFKASPELLTPYLLRQIELSFKKSGSKKVVPEHKLTSVDTREFVVFFQFMLKKHPDIPKRLASGPRKIWRLLGRAFRRFQNKNRTFYATKYEKEHEIGLHFVDNDFMEAFGISFHASAQRWQAKMDAWYKDEILWRGLTNTDKELSEKEIISVFDKLSYHMVSNNILNTARTWTHAELRKKALADMKRYNGDLFNGGLAEMAMDHSRAGDLYPQSYGYSTSDKYAVGKAFAMGAMVIAEYGKHTDLELQKQLKSRIVVGAKRAKKDVDLMRLKPLRDEFSNKYWRQSEVMGIGAADPDSIMIIKSLDEHGEAIRTYARNPKKPNEIWVIKGDFDFDKQRAPRKAQIEKVVEL